MLQLTIYKTPKKKFNTKVLVDIEKGVYENVVVGYFTVQ